MLERGLADRLLRVMDGAACDMGSIENTRKIGVPRVDDDEFPGERRVT